MKRQPKPFVVERRRRLPAAGQPGSIWSDVMTPELRAMAHQVSEHKAPAAKDAGAGARPLQAPTKTQPMQRTGRILISRVDPAPVRAEPMKPPLLDELKPDRRRPSARRSTDIRGPDVTVIPTETTGIVPEATDAEIGLTSLEAPLTSSENAARVPYRARRREATKGLKLEDRWKRGLILPD